MPINNPNPGELKSDEERDRGTVIEKEKYEEMKQRRGSKEARRGR